MISIQKLLEPVQWTPEQTRAAEHALDDDEVSPTPMVMRFLLAGGTWVGAGMVALFLAITSIFEHDGVRLVAGVFFFAAAAVLSRVRRGDVVTQLVFIGSLSGQGMILTGIPRHYSHLGPDLETYVQMFLLLQGLSVVLIHNAFHRVLSTVGLVGAVMVLGVVHQVSGTSEVLCLTLPVLVVALMLNETRISASPWGRPRSSLLHGLVASWLLLILVCVMVQMFPESATSEEVQSLAFGSPLLVSAVQLSLYALVVRRARLELNLPVVGGPSVLAVAAGVILTLLTWEVPGIMAGLLLLTLAHLRRDKHLHGTALVFLAVFLGRFYYALSVPLLAKSVMVLASGASLLVVRALLVLVVKGGSAASLIPASLAIGKRAWVMWAGVALTVGSLGVAVAQKERVLANGKVVLLKLAPVDPRSLMQGDYMVLRYAVAQDAFRQHMERDGHLVLRLDDQQVATLVRIDDGTALAEGEQLLRYRWRSSSVRLGAESYLFEEGRADHFSAAKFGELRVAPDGTSVLVGLRNAELQPL